MCIRDRPQVDYPVPHEAPVTQQLLARSDRWYVPAALLDEELRRQNSATIDVSLCLNTTADAERAKRTISTRDASARLGKKDELVANSLWRFLELRDFLNEQHTHSAYGKALHAALQKVRVNDRVQEPLYLALELLRANVLHGDVYSGTAYSGGPSFGSEAEMQHMLLVMRVLSLLPMAFKPQAWDAPLSREMLVFNSFAKALSRSLRSLVEMVTLTLLLKSESRQPREDYLDLSLSLPFQTDTNTGMGIVVKCYLDAIYTLHGGAIQENEKQNADVVESKDTVVEMLVETFENIRDVPLELRRGFRLWAALMEAIEVLAAEHSITPTVAEQFRAADAWLKPMML